jgi:hypothetical protein
LIAPVRLRAVASGLIIEKVRSIAMISSLKSAAESAALISTLSANGKRSGDDRAGKCGNASMPKITTISPR